MAISLTAGEACLDHVGIAIADLASRRLREWRDAVAVPGAQADRCWGFSDGRLGRYVEEISDRLTAELTPTDAVLVPSRYDPHPDHEAAGQAVRLAVSRTGAAVIEYPVWLTYRYRPADGAAGTNRLAVVATDKADDQAREHALGCYLSQLRPLRSDLTPVVPGALLDHHRRQLVILSDGPHA